MRVMGVDPGLVDTGFGVLEGRPGVVTVVDAGVVSSAAGPPLEARLNAIHGAMCRIIEARRPELLVVEDLYTEYKFPRTAILMGHARGVIYLAARQCGVAVLALAASEVKRAVTGNGAAGKSQMQRGVQTLLGLAELPQPSHVADALGLALTGLARVAGITPGRPRAVDWRAAAKGEASGYGDAGRAERGGRAAAKGEASGYMMGSRAERGRVQP